MKKSLLLGAALVLACPVAALAATDVAIPVADWANGVAGFLNAFAVPLVGLLVTFLFRKVPAAYVTAQNRAAVEQLLEKAIQFGINKATAALPANVSVPVTNDIIAEAAKYAISHAPAVVEWAGGAKAIEEKILARLNVTAP